jgi:hypothetical protein
MYTLIGALIGALGIYMTRLPPPTAIVAPPPRFDNTGVFLSPYTSTGAVASWVLKGLAAERASRRETVSVWLRPILRMPGFPVRGRSTAEAARLQALMWVGGESTMKATSDLSFNNVDDLITYVYVNRGKSRDAWDETLWLMEALYPDIPRRWSTAIKHARRHQ